MTTNSEESETVETLHTIGEGQKEVVAHHYKPEISEKANELSYFLVDPPKNIIEGIANSEYNLAKGVLAGTALAVTAPFICSYDEAVKGEVIRCK